MHTITCYNGKQTACQVYIFSKILMKVLREMNSVLHETAKQFTHPFIKHKRTI